MGLLLKELLLSFVRHALPVATSYLAGLGIEINGADPVVTVVVAGVIYGLMQAWSFWRKWRRERAEKVTRAPE